MKKLPKGIRMRGAKYQVDVTVNGKRKTATVDTLAAAVAKQEAMREGLVLGKAGAVDTRRSNARTWTLREALEKTRSIPAREGWRGAAYEKQATLNIEDAIQFMGEEIPLDMISRDLIDAWCHSCEAKGNSDSTINRKISSLSKVLRVAVSYGGLGAMPPMPKQRKEPVGRIRQLSKDEEDKLLLTIHMLGYRDVADAVVVLIDTGMRCSELWNVRDADVDMKGKVMLVYGVEGKGTKNGTYRSVPMTSRVHEILSSRMGKGQPFPYSNSWLRHPWDRARSIMGLTDDKNFSPHVLRHTCCSRLVRAGTPLPVVQKWMGHKNIQTTMRYSHMMPTDLMDAVKALEGELSCSR